MSPAPPSSNESREVALPARALAGLGAALRAEAGPVVAAQTLHRAGYRAAEFFYPALDATEGDAGDGLEVECRSRGDGRCVFAFGTEMVVRELHAHLLEGRSLEQVLEDL